VRREGFVALPIQWFTKTSTPLLHRLACSSFLSSNLSFSIFSSRFPRISSAHKFHLCKRKTSTHHSVVSCCAFRFYQQYRHSLPTPTMKLSVLTLLFSAVLAPLTVVSATQYKCETVGVFHSKDDTKNPHVPTKAELDWMAGEMLQTFTSAYQSNSDMDMKSERFSKFSMKRESSPDGGDDDDGDTITGGGSNSTSFSFMDSATSMLGNLRKSRRWTSYYCKLMWSVSLLLLLLLVVSDIQSIKVD
jgi:hypothetical protein